MVTEIINHSTLKSQISPLEPNLVRNTPWKKGHIPPIGKGKASTQKVPLGGDNVLVSWRGRRYTMENYSDWKPKVMELWKSDDFPEFQFLVIFRFEFSKVYVPTTYSCFPSHGSRFLKKYPRQILLKMQIEGLDDLRYAMLQVFLDSIWAMKKTKNEQWKRTPGCLGYAVDKKHSYQGLKIFGWWLLKYFSFLPRFSGEMIQFDLRISWGYPPPTMPVK